MYHEEVNRNLAKLSELFLVDKERFLIDINTIMESSKLFNGLSPGVRQRIIEMILDDFKFQRDYMSLSVGLFDLFNVDLN